MDDGTGCARDGGAEGVCCAGVCVDTQGDPNNCDGCGQICPAGSSCIEGGCTIGGRVAMCVGDGGCTAPLVCAGGYFCVPAMCGTGSPGGACGLAGGDQGRCCSGACRPLTDYCPEVLPDAGPNTGNDAGTTATADGGLDDAGPRDGGAMNGADAGDGG